MVGLVGVEGDVLDAEELEVTTGHLDVDTGSPLTCWVAATS